MQKKKKIVFFLLVRKYSNKDAVISAFFSAKSTCIFRVKGRL